MSCPVAIQATTHPPGRLAFWKIAAVAGMSVAAGPLLAASTAPATNRTASIAAAKAAAPTNAFPGFRLQKGFRLELVASEPLTVAPVAMAFDENGRLFVAEMASPPQGQVTGRIRLLEEPDKNGVFTASTVYADDVPWPSSLACYNGGVFVASTPNILYLRDTKRNGIADVRQVVFKGFGGSSNSVAPDALVNSLQWGMDNRIHGITAGIGGEITGPSMDTPLDLGQNDFSFDPRSLTLRAESGPGQSGLAFDTWGRTFLSDSSRPLRYPAFALPYLLRNPFAPAPKPLLDLLSPATRVYRLPAVEERSGGSAASAGANTNAPVPGWFASARGTTVYRGTAYPSNYWSNVFLADPAARIVHRAALRETGLFPAAARPSDADTSSEFLACSEPDFQPYQLVNGPEGVLYLADRNSGAERGRIYRIVPENFVQPKVPQLGRAGTYDLVASLAAPNAWQSDTAARLVYERQDPAASPLLTNMVNNSRLVLARIRALHCLVGLGALPEAPVTKALKDSNPQLREHALRVSENLLREAGGSDELRRQLQTLISDTSERVRYQLAFTLGDVRLPGKAQVLTELLARDSANPWFQTAVLSSLGSGAPEMVSFLSRYPRLRADPALHVFLPKVATMVGVRGQLSEVGQVLDFLYTTKLDAQLTFGLLASLGEGLRRTRSSLPIVDQKGALQPFYTSALNTAIDETVPLANRVQAVRLLGVSSMTFAEVGDWLLLMLSPGSPQQLESAAISALARFQDPRAATELLKRWPTFNPQLRQETIDALLSRNDSAVAVLNAVQSGAIPAAGLSSVQVDLLRTYRDPVLSSRAQQLFGPAQTLRPAVMQKFAPAARLTGTAARGRELFAARCTGCHRSSTGSAGLGPEMMSAALRGKEKLLSDIIEPNAAIRPENRTWLAETKDSLYFIGILAHQNPLTISLVQADGSIIVLPRANLQAVTPEPWSLMPTGLESGLSLQNMADLLEYVATPGAL